MTRPPHRLRVPHQVVKAFGSEIELIAALRRFAKHPSLWDEGIVDLEVPDETWELYRGPQSLELWRLRAAIMLALLELKPGQASKRQPGTLMIAERETVCPYCDRPIRPSTLMVNTYAPDGMTRGVHVSCSDREGIPYRAGKRLIDGIRRLERGAIDRYLTRELGRRGR